MAKIVAICSGGLDSTILYYDLISHGNEVYPINFNYGSKHNNIERSKAIKLIPDIKLIDIDLSFLKSSSLISKEVEVPHGHYQAENMKSTVVPFRNGIMLSYAVAYAEELGAKIVMFGAHSGDHHIYPDCRIDFIDNFSESASVGTYNNIEVQAPYSNFDKGYIVFIGKKLNIEHIMKDTWSCYEGKDIHCGECGSCTERKEAFKLAGVIDQTMYAK